MKHTSNPVIKILLLLLLVGCSCATTRAQTINDAVHQGDIALVRRMLRANPNLARFRGADSNMPLHWAAWDGRVDIASLLIGAGADVNDRRSMDGGTPLWIASWVGHNDVVKLLLQHGADPGIRSNDSNTALHEAVANGHLDAVTQLLNRGQNIETLNGVGNTPLCVAAECGTLDVAKHLVAVGADIHHQNNRGKTPLELAIATNHEDVAGLLRDYQAALDERAARELARAKAFPLFRKGYQNWGEQSVQTKEIYTTAFAGTTVGPEWSTQPLPGAQQGALQISVTPTGRHRFLGELGSQSVHLALPTLPTHTMASIAFALYIIRTWDGNSFWGGPDIFTLSAVGSPPLLHTTFQNPSFLEHDKYRIQAYPGEYPGDHYVPRSGAVEVDSLGFLSPVDGVSAAMDAVYEISYTFSHHDRDLTIEFAAKDLEALDNESWGIANVQVSVANEVITKVATPTLARHSAATPAPAPSPRTVSHAVTRHTTPPKSRAVHRAATAGKKPTASHPSHPATRLHPKEKPPGL